MKRRPSEWLKYVKMYVDDGIPMTKLAAKYKIDISKLKHKVKVYLMHGEYPFTNDHNNDRIVVELKNSPLKYKVKNINK